jgi:DNA-binding NtrC family response regulator
VKTILVVDDDEKIRRILGQMLKGKGYNVINANNAVEAHRMTSEEKQVVDLILLDINMPAVPGDIFYEVMRAFHAQNKVIVCSVLPVEEQIKRVPGATDYYDKSESFSVLIEKIERVLGDELVKKKILIVNDDPLSRQLNSKLLMRAGYRPIESGYQPENADLFIKQKEQIALVLLNISEPESNGFEFFDTIKKVYPLTKVIITGVLKANRQKYSTLSADDYFDISEGPKRLLEKIKRLIDQ